MFYVCHIDYYNIQNEQEGGEDHQLMSHSVLWLTAKVKYY